MIPAGKSVMIWQLKNCCNGSMSALAWQLKDAHIKHAWIKVADGEVDFNADLMAAAVAALREQQIGVWGWQYLYGGNKFIGTSIAAQEAEAAIRNIKRYALDGFVLDPESHYKRPGAQTWASTYMTKLRAVLPDITIGLCSYRFPSLHPELPWQAFLRSTDFHAPQVYWKLATDPGKQLDRSVRELTGLRKLPIVPVGAAFSEGGWSPTVKQIDEFDCEAHLLNLPGVSWWAWDDRGIEAHPDWYNAISNHRWLGGPGPFPQRWEDAIDQWARTMGYMGPKPDAN